MTKAIYCAFFAMLATIMIRRPAAAAGALICTWAVDQWARSQDPWFFQNHGLTNWITSLFVIAAIGLRALKGKPVFKPLTREYILTCAIYGLALTSVIWSIRVDDTINQFWATYKVIVIMGFLMPLTISDIDDLRTTLYTILIVGFTISALVMTTGTWEGRTLMFEVGNVLTEQGGNRGNPLAIAGVAGYVALAAMLMNFRGAARIFQILRYGIIALVFALSIKSGSRGQTISILFCTICFLPYSRRFKDIKSFATLAISLALFAAVTLYILKVLTADPFGNGENERWSWEAFQGAYVGGRVETSMRLLSVWATSSPIYWIIGLGSSASFDPNICGFYPHVVFAEVLGELGLIGWAILWMFPIYSYLGLREIWPSVKDDPEERGLIATLGALILFEIMMSFKQGSLLGGPLVFGFIIMLGRINKTLRQKRAQQLALDAGMYQMTDADWSDTGEYYDDLPAGVAVAHRNA